MLSPNRFDFFFLSCLQLTFCQPRVRLPGDLLGIWTVLPTHRVLVLVDSVILSVDLTRPLVTFSTAIIEPGDEVLAVSPDDDLLRLQTSLPVCAKNRHTNKIFCKSSIRKDFADPLPSRIRSRCFF